MERVVPALVLALAAVLVLGGACASRTGDAGWGVTLSAQVAPAVPRDVAARFPDAGALWTVRTRTLVYVSVMGYSSSCPPDARARVTAGGAVVLELVDTGRHRICTADLGRVAVVVDGLDHAPARITVTDGGATRSIPVALRSAAPSWCRTEPGLTCSSAGPRVD